MDDDEVDAGQFEPIAQMRRLAVVLPKALEPVDQIPVKLCLPEPLDPDLFSELLTEQEDPTSKHESVKTEKDLPMKGTKSYPDKHETKEWEEREREKKASEKIGSNKKESEKKETEKKESEKKEQQKSGREKKESERKEMEKNATETKEAEKKGSSKKRVKRKKQKGKSLKRKNRKKIAREKKELERKEREKNATETKEREKIDCDQKDYENREHERKENVLKNRRDDIRSKETSGKQNYWSESEMSSVSITSQLSLRPGRNMRATPLSRASSRNTNYDDLHFEVDPNEGLGKYRPWRAVKAVTDMRRKESRTGTWWINWLMEGGGSIGREIHRYYVKSMINDAYKRKRNGIGFSSDLDHPAPNRGRLLQNRDRNLPSPIEASIQVMPTMSQSIIIIVQSVQMQQQPPIASLSTTATATLAEGQLTGSGRSKWVDVQSAEPLTSVKGSDEVENVIQIIKEEFKRLGFL